MFKNLLKSRRDPRKEVPKASSESRHPSTGSVKPIEYSWGGPGQPQPLPSEYSVNPVDYRLSPVRPPGPELPTPSYSTEPVEYTKSPLEHNYIGAPDTSAITSPVPVAYRASAPMSTSEQTDVHPKTDENLQRLQQQNAPIRYTYTVDSPPPPSPTQPRELPASDQTFNKHAYFMSTQRPVELPGSTVPPRYELPNDSVRRRTPIPPRTPQQDARQSPHLVWPSPNGSSTTLVSSPRSEVHSPTLGHAKYKVIPSPSGNADEGIKKFVVDIYCPLKRDTSGNRREQIPRDIREFRLAKVALIPIVAGKRTFLSLDVVFGDIDKLYSDIVEKHFSCSHETKLTKLQSETVQGGEVHTVGPLNIAYRDGESATVYVKFATADDESRFKAAFWDMWQYVEHTAE